MRDVERAGVVGGGDGSRHAGPQLAFLPHEPEHAFERLVVEIRRAAELRVVRVDRERLASAGHIVLVIEQVAIGVNQRRAVELQRPSPVQLFRLGGRDVGDLGHRVFVFAIGLATLDVFQAGQQRGAVAVELAFQVVATQELHRAVGRLRAAPRNQVERAGQRIARRVADFHPFGARCAAAGERRRKADSRQSSIGAVAAACDRNASALAWSSARRWPRSARPIVEQLSRGERAEEHRRTPVGRKDSQSARLASMQEHC